MSLEDQRFCYGLPGSDWKHIRKGGQRNAKKVGRGRYRDPREKKEERRVTMEQEGPADAITITLVGKGRSFSMLSGNSRVTPNPPFAREN
jgi:hypothetical protein